VEKAEKLLRASEAKIQHSQGGGAFYHPSTDTIHLPARERFETAAGYYATALHELGHYAVMGNDEVWWKADLWLLVTPTKRRADRVQPPFCATSVQAILKNLHWEIL
jgi:antirestriction protein ArdC